MAEHNNTSPILTPRGFSLVLCYLLLGIISVLFLAPVFWMLSSALKPEWQIFAIPPVWLPNPPRWQNFAEGLTSLPFARFAANTLLIALTTIIGHLLSCSIVAYGFARFKARGSNFLFMLMLATLMLPYPVVMVPLYIIFSKIGWVNSFAPLIVPAFFWQRLLYFSFAPGIQTNPG